MSVSFAWLLAVLILIGLYRLGLLVAKARHVRVACLVAVSVLAVVSLVGHAQEMRVVFRNEGNLAALNVPALREAYGYLDRHPGSTVLIREQNPIVMGWLSYHGRRSSVYVDRTLLQEGYLPAGDWAFYAAPPDMGKALVWDSEGLKPAWRMSSSPSVEVRNRQGKERDASNLWYWMGDELEFFITVPDEESAAQRWTLEFVAMPGPSNPILSRRLALILAGAPDVTIEIQGRETVRVPVKLRRGTNIVYLRSLWPTE